MDEQALRALVREAVARHLGRDTAPEPAPTPAPGAHHWSHLRLPVASGTEIDGPCLIEPAVHCNHCGYCQSYGH
jgi:hypothetical protein